MSPKPILIAHQDETIRDGIKNTLSNSLPLIVLESITDVLDILKQNKNIPRLLFLEINDTTPSSFIEEIRTITPCATIILLAHPKDEVFALEGVRCGANGYVFSPFKPQEILHLSR